MKYILVFHFELKYHHMCQVQNFHLKTENMNINDFYFQKKLLITFDVLLLKCNL
jgi:hypothetical protein